MKTLTLLATLFLCFKAIGQDSVYLATLTCNPEQRIDKFDGTKSYTYYNTKEKISWHKVIGDKDTFYGLSLRTYSSYASYSGNEGMYILLDSGKKIVSSSEKIDIEYVSDGYYEYSCFYTLTYPDIQLLLKYGITDFKLYIFDGNEITDQRKKKYREQINCLYYKF